MINAIKCFFNFHTYSKWLSATIIETNRNTGVLISEKEAEGRLCILCGGGLELRNPNHAKCINCKKIKYFHTPLIVEDMADLKADMLYRSDRSAYTFEFLTCNPKTSKDIITVKDIFHEKN